MNVSNLLILRRAIFSGALAILGASSVRAQPVITTQPVSVTKAAGHSATLTATIGGDSLPYTYQWMLNGVSTTGPGGPVTVIINPSPTPQTVTLSLTNLSSQAAGAYTLVVSDSSGTVTSDPAVVTVVYDAHLTNFSTRATVTAGASIFIGGFNISGTTSDTVLLRGVGPGLASTFQLPGVLAAPRLVLTNAKGETLYDSDTSGLVEIPENAFAQEAQAAVVAAIAAAVGAFPIQTSAGDIEEVFTLPPGGYTAQVSSDNGGSGLALLEIYEVQ
jgi:Ig-like domain-containing protein